VVFENFLKQEQEKIYFKELMEYISSEYSTKTIFPPRELVMDAIKYATYENIKVVIVGQDPYHGEGEAHGLCFSVNLEAKTPPSLKNIYKELARDLNCYIPNNGHLIKWAKQGVLLLNSVLTVVKDTPGSHRNKGWETFTDEIIKLINQKETPVVFLLWGVYAKAKKSLITNPRHLVLESTHPSPFSVKHGFEDCKHFSKTNKFLKANKLSQIDWQIENT